MVTQLELDIAKLRKAGLSREYIVASMWAKYNHKYSIQEVELWVTLLIASIFRCTGTTWRNVFDTTHLFALDNFSKVLSVFIESRYPFFAWNGKIYEISRWNDGQVTYTGLDVDDIK